ncbi:MAG: hypothetical protein JST16_08415 [Bdellovibrionales bacterium]|nr:hypothetical protein [Bdellovibrionales bacterium]
MKPRQGSGNLRDFRIDERLPGQNDPLGAPLPPVSHSSTPPAPPRQWVKARQEPTSAPAAQHEWSLNDSGQAPMNADTLWSSWEQEASAGLDLGQSVAPVAPAPMVAAQPLPQSQVISRAPVAPPPSAAPAEAPAMSGQAKTDVVAGPVPWAADLALEERRMERSGTVDYTNSYQKQDILRARTREFTSLLQKTFREHIEVFNESRRSPAHHIHVYRVSNSDEDFMLYRNHVKLVVSGSRAGRIVFAFNQYMGQIFAPTQTPVVEVEASWGPFDQLFWSYKGERVQLMDLVRYFTTEFVRQSFR